MNWYEIFRFDHIQQQLLFFLAGMPGNVDRRNRIIDHVRAPAQHAVDRAADTLFIPRDRMR